jgi:nicotinic acid mononucleotide adenylyltransferase
LYFKLIYKKVNDIEIKNNKYYPTWDLIETLQDQHKNFKFIFCIGTDLINSLEDWDNGFRLINEVNFIVIKRPDFNPQSTQFPLNYRMLESITDGSSTKIRNRIQQQIDAKNKINLGINGLTTVSVINYIKKNSLYHRD